MSPHLKTVVLAGQWLRACLDDASRRHLTRSRRRRPRDAPAPTPTPAPALAPAPVAVSRCCCPVPVVSHILPRASLRAHRPDGVVWCSWLERAYSHITAPRDTCLHQSKRTTRVGAAESPLSTAAGTSRHDRRCRGSTEPGDTGARTLCPKSNTTLPTRNV